MNTPRYHIYKINKNGVAKLDCRSDDIKSVYMIVCDLKESKRQGYVWDHILGKVTQNF